ncbi:hypothetical protein MGYG_00527 [Nannizzia gypsea CBS 118893]|uniref:Uncharacterized protein n=1 Tax=Arthroderma gypseum (strain ATCC MYA-4604 / CBS 118893) TaxID=535722 RepID=E5R076_ARTGP|nr:hypothetical protein MGYG_00527 [Nannizzia gypsea CBS 118893]EFQ97487.1 hypothetical protein MGYG_00527 [Nannizzia gypsea CBS 118893]
MALRNPTDTWPLGLRFIMTIKPQDEQAPPPVDGFIMYPRHGYTSGSSPTSSSFFFAINGTELIHKYSPGWFTILGYFEVEHTCIDVQPGLGIREYSYFSDPFKVNFAVSDGAPLPDIEAAVNLCPNHTAWLKPYGVQKYTNCFLRNITADLPPVSDPCLVKPFANELAADVSRTMLDLMGCPDGDWRTIKEPCPPMETKRSGVPRKEPGLVSLLAAAVISAWVVL